jgi:hypothetical protein
MRRKILNTLIGSFILLLLGFFIYYSMNKPRIFILQSYGKDYSWTSDVDSGIKRVLAKHPYSTVRFHYMDTKNHPEDAFKKKAGILARSIINEWQPNVVIAVDDDAQEFVGRYFLNHPKINIVYAGINGSIEPYGYDKADNAAGIVERKQLLAVKDTFMMIAQKNGMDRVRIFNIGDTSGSVKSDEKFIKGFEWDPVIFTGSKLASTFDEWKAAVKDAEDKADFLLLTNYRKLKASKNSSELVAPEEVVRWTLENSSIPGIGTNGFNVDDDGYMFAIGVSPFEQGEVAAQIAVDIIEKGKKAKDFKMASTQEFTVHIREKGVKRYNLIIPKVYEAFARAANSYYSD